MPELFCLVNKPDDFQYLIQVICSENVADVPQCAAEHAGYLCDLHHKVAVAGHDIIVAAGISQIAFLFIIGFLIFSGRPFSMAFHSMGHLD